MFVLEVSGDSMIDDHIADGDYVVVPQAEHRPAGPDRRRPNRRRRSDAEALVSRTESHRIRLEPANSTMKPIYVKDARIVGVVVGVVRRVE